jgi:hypothetical protein
MRNRIAAIEGEMSELARRMKEVEAMLADPDHYREGRKAFETAREHQALEERKAALTAEWEQLTAEIDRLTSEFEREAEEMRS